MDINWWPWILVLFFFYVCWYIRTTEDFVSFSTHFVNVSETSKSPSAPDQTTLWTSQLLYEIQRKVEGTDPEKGHMIRTTCFIFVGLRLCHRSSFVIHVSLHRVLSRSQSKILTSQTCSVFFQILSSKSSLDTNFNFFIQQKCSHSFTMMFFRSHKRLGYRRGDTPPSMMLQKIPLSYLLSENARHL